MQVSLGEAFHCCRGRINAQDNIAFHRIERLGALNGKEINVPASTRHFLTCPVSDLSQASLQLLWWVPLCGRQRHVTSLQYAFTIRYECEDRALHPGCCETELRGNKRLQEPKRST